MKKTILAVMFLLFVIVLSACSGRGKLAYDNNMDSDTYNQNLFYRNDLLTMAPDPSVIQVTEGEDAGAFYMYSTSNEIDCSGVQVFRSEDLNLWTCIGVAFAPEEESWCYRDIWAPEVIYYEGKYYMTFTGRDRYTDNNALQINLAVSDNPAGPFVQWSGTNSDGDEITLKEPWFDISKSSLDYLVTEDIIDSHFFIDTDGTLYLYFTCSSLDEGSSIFGCKMKDFFTPDYSTVVQLTRSSRKNVDDEVKTLNQSDEKYVNEGPFVIEHEGTYYLTYSVQGFNEKGYAVKQAVSDSPLGPYTKVDVDKGGKILTAVEDYREYVNENGDSIIIDDYDQMSGTGHHCFITVGDEVYIMYHGHNDRMYGGGVRSIAMDKLYFAENEDGQTVIHINGPTYSVQPLPAAISGYGNIAGLASVTATNARSGSDTALLNDGLVRMHNMSVAQDFVAEKGTEITLTFDQYYDVRAIMVYNSYYYDKLWSQVDSITLYTDAAKTGKSSVEIKNLKFDTEWHVDQSLQFVRAGGSAIAEFNELPVNKIVIKINSNNPIAIGDIVVLGRQIGSHEGEYVIDSYSYENPAADEGHWRDMELNDGITMDGVLDEAIWEENNWLSYTSQLSDSYKSKVSTYFGAEGVYFAAYVYDPNVSWNSSKPIYQNSSVELMFCPADTFTKDYYTLQLRVAVNGEIDQYRGVATGHGAVNDSYAWTITNYPAMVRTSGLGFDVKYLQDAVDETNVEGYCIEAYVPYSALGLTERPASIRMMPSFNQVPSSESTNRTSNVPDGISFDMVTSYFTFDTYGVVLPEEGENLGYCSLKMQTVGWDTSKDNGADPQAHQAGAGQQYIFLKDHDFNATSYYFETKISANKILDGDAYPKFGLITLNNANCLYYCVEASDLRENLDTLTVTGSLGTDAWNWTEISWSRMNKVLTGKYTDDSYVTLGMLRDGDTFYFFVNGEFTGTRTDVAGFTAESGGYLGLLTMNIDGDFFDYSVTTDETELEAMLKKAGGKRFYDEFLGNAPDGMDYSIGFDLSTGMDGFVTQDGADQQYVFFKNEQNSNFVVSAKITATSILNADQYPRFGLIAGVGMKVVYFNVEASNLKATVPMYVTGQLGTGDWDWGGMTRFEQISTGAYTGGQTVELTLVKSGSVLYFYVNSVYAGQADGSIGITADTAMTVGFLTMNIAGQFSDYYVDTDPAVIQSWVDLAK